MNKTFLVFVGYASAIFFAICLLYLIAKLLIEFVNCLLPIPKIKQKFNQFFEVKNNEDTSNKS